jgi:hypothetical protein
MCSTFCCVRDVATAGEHEAEFSPANKYLIRKVVSRLILKFFPKPYCKSPDNDVSQTSKCNFAVKNMFDLKVYVFCTFKIRIVGSDMKILRQHRRRTRESLFLSSTAMNSQWSRMHIMNGFLLFYFAYFIFQAIFAFLPLLMCISYLVNTKWIITSADHISRRLWYVLLAASVV